jgi:hypothetical protein
MRCTPARGFPLEAVEPADLRDAIRAAPRANALLSRTRAPRTRGACQRGENRPHDRGSGRKGVVYVLDEPTTGLHLADVEQLLGLLDRLVDSGKSVIVIEHHQSVMAHADWIIDLGPGAGHDGGRIVFEGTAADLVADQSTLTGEQLAV